MARKNLECGRPTPEKAPRSGAPGFNNSTSNNNNNKKPSHTTPNAPRVRSPEERSPRLSPGLLAGHYAGCKWSEPPSPSTLPAPPQHWMQATSPHSIIVPFHEKPNLVGQHDIATQLKVLLKVQA